MINHAANKQAMIEQIIADAREAGFTVRPFNGGPRECGTFGGAEVYRIDRRFGHSDPRRTPGLCFYPDLTAMRIGVSADVARVITSVKTMRSILGLKEVLS